MLTAKEYSGSEYPFDASNQAVLFLSSLLHAEHLQHLCCGSEADDSALLANRKGGNEYQNQPVLPEGQAELWMTNELKPELAVPALKLKPFSRQTPHWQATRYKWT